MADLFSSLSRSALPRVGQERSKGDGLRTWFEAGSYRVDTNTLGQIICLADIDLAEIVPYISFDYERFALSSWESCRGAIAKMSTGNAAAWSLLELYYSAFFAAHAIMRVSGEAIIKLEASQTDVLQAASDVAVASTAPIEPGMFAVRVRQTGDGSIAADVVKQLKGPGAHEGFWKAFDDFLQRLAARAVANQEPDAQALVAGVSELQASFRPHKLRRSAWISSVRNEINYQHQHGVWFPKGAPKRTFDMMANISEKSSASVRLDYSLDGDAIEAFASVSLYLASLNVELAEVVAANATASRSFGQNWRRLRKEI